MDPIKIEQLFDQVEAGLKRAGSERVQLFCMQKFLVELEGNYATYDSYVIQLFQYLPDLNHPLLFTGFHPKRLKKIISLCEVAVESIPELKENKAVSRKLQSLGEGLRHIEHWLKIDKGKSRDRSLTLTNFSESYEPDSGEVFIPVVESSGSVKPMGRLRKLKVEVVGKSQRNEHELRPVFGVIGANTGNLGELSAKAAGNLLQESVGQNNFWKGTAHFELSHTWHAGNSANLAMSGLFYCEMLKAENKREYFQLNPGIAITGDVDEDGKVLEVEESSLIHKTEAAFFSWAQVLVVPVQQLELVSTYLDKMKEEFPERNLALKGVGSMRELYFDRRITLHKQTSMAVHTAKKVWKRRNTIGFTLIVLLLLGIIGGLIYGPIDKNPVTIEYSGDFLVLGNKNGLEVGRIEAGSNAMISLEQNYSFNPKVLLYDLNEDGINEVIWAKNAINTHRERTFVQAYSLLGDSVIWEMPLTMDYEFPRQHFEMDQTMNIKELAVIGSSNDAKLVIVGNLSMFFQATVSIVDLRSGEIEQEYVHIGQINDMAAIDINEDGKEEIILTGVNNAFWMASIIVLDPENIQGHSPLEGDYVIDGLDRADEMYYILMPKTITGEYLSYLEKQSLGYRIFTNSERKTLMVEVYETYRRLNSYTERSFYYVYLNYDMQASGFATSDLYDIIARELYEEGHIPFIPDYDYWESFKDSLLYWNGREFVHEPTVNAKYVNEIGENKSGE